MVCMKIIDKFLTTTQNKNIEKQLMDQYFPWYYIDSNIKGGDYYQFTHLLVLNEKINSDYFEVIAKPILDKIKYKRLLRVRVNLFTRDSKNVACPKHQDDGTPHKVCVYYVNTNNGYTFLDQGGKVESKRNRALFFNGKIMHQVVSQTDEKKRLTVNITYQ